MTKRSVKHATFVIERVYDAQPATVELHQDGSGTRLMFTESGAYLDEFDNPEMREHGTTEILDALGAYLDGRKTGRALAPAVEGG